MGWRGIYRHTGRSHGPEARTSAWRSYNPYDYYHVRMAVKESFKGIATDYAVSDTASVFDCSPGKMEIGHDYLIYATMSGDSKVELGGCKRTHMLPPDGNASGSRLPRDWRYCGN